MNRFLWVIVFCVLGITCSHESSEEIKDTTISNDISYIQGNIRLNVSEDLAAQLESMDDSLQNAPFEIQQVIGSLNIKHITRVFPYAGKFEARTRAEGLHRWYDVTFDESQSMTRAATEFKALDGVVYVETRSPISTTAFSYNDPYFKKQWYFQNKEGADINMVSAWNLVTPNPDVIVAVVDGGIDIDHPDLMQNMWTNTAEMNGQSGVDDDGNGYVDDIYGYNFVDNNGTIVGHNHGSHVAGVIGAKNNNGEGICSTAGGCSADDGVRLMSCQIFQAISADKDKSSNDVTSAIKYGADNGALISQNSWCYDNATQLYNSDKAAIDYFIKYAGIDENGNQVGLMKGGVVFFAAGNSHKNIAYPSSYEKVIAVCAINSDYSLASYSNYGNWVDLSAPGTNIYSTFNNNTYDFSDGTSMACPLVSGVAALVISKYGGKGFTNNDLITLITKNTISIDSYNPSYVGEMGSGLLNAYYALANHNSLIAPNAVCDIQGKVQSNQTTLSWKVTADEDDEKALGYYVYYSKTNDFSIRDSVSVLTSSMNEGDSIGTTISGLDFETLYFFKIKAFDFSRNLSDDSPIVSFKTKINHAPKIITIDSNHLILKSCETATLRFKRTDEDQHISSWSHLGDLTSLVFLENSDTISIVFNAALIETGHYSLILKTTDAYGLSDEVPIKLQVLENHAPTVVSIPNIYQGNLNDETTLVLNDYFTDEDDSPLNYSVNSDNYSLYMHIKNNNLLYLGPSAYGLSHITITATDPKGLQCSTSFMLMCRDDAYDVELYPNPVNDYLHLRVGENCDTSLRLHIYNSSGVMVFEQSCEISTFAPASVDLRSLTGGSYSVLIDFNGRHYQQNIVKL